MGVQPIWRRTGFYLALAVAFFFGGAVCGGLLPYLSMETAGRAVAMIDQALAPLVGRLRSSGVFAAIAIIFLNNLRVSGLAVLGGPTFFFPALIVFGNGVTLGLLGMYNHLSGRMTLGRFALSILPHGLIELPAVFLAAAIGWRLGLALWRRLLRLDPPEILRETAAASARQLLAVAGLLLAAAVVEVVVTMAIV